MLEEAVEVIRLLWRGGSQSHRGRHYRVENAQLFDLPEEAPPIIVSGFGPKATDLAARIGDGYATTSPDKELIERFRSQGGSGKPVQAGTKVCWAESESDARRTAHRLWPTSGLNGELSQLLPTPAHFEQATSLVTEDMVAESITCGPDVDAHIEALREYADAGVDELFVQQVGPDQDGFFQRLREGDPPALRRSSGAGGLTDPGALSRRWQSEVCAHASLVLEARGLIAQAAAERRRTATASADREHRAPPRVLEQQSKRGIETETGERQAQQPTQPLRVVLPLSWKRPLVRKRAAAPPMTTSTSIFEPAAAAAGSSIAVPAKSSSSPSTSLRAPGGEVSAISPNESQVPSGTPMPVPAMASRAANPMSEAVAWSGSRMPEARSRPAFRRPPAASRAAAR